MKLDEINEGTSPKECAKFHNTLLGAAIDSHGRTRCIIIKTTEGTIIGENVGCACLRRLQRGPFLNYIFTTDISVYFI